MKKMMKMSLAAAVAVAGLTTTASAGALADAVKDTTISGKVEVGYNYADTQTGSAASVSTNEWEYDFDATLNTKVNDTITAQVGIQADHETAINSAANETTDTNGKDSITLTKMNFTAKTDVATAIVGKQKQPTPFLDDERGDGVVALVPAGPVTLAAGHFTGLTAPTTQDLTAAAVIGSFAGVNASLWYVTSSTDTDVDVTGYSVNVNGAFGPVTVDARHSQVNYETTGLDVDAKLTKIVANANMDAFGVTVAYGMTNDEPAARTAGAGVDLTSTDNDAATNLETEHFALDDLNDASAYLIGANAGFGAVSVGAHYFAADDKADTDYTEMAVNASYAMSKNFTASAVYATSETDYTGGSTTDVDKDTFEVSLKYSF
jgi:hypothetical protein